MRTRQSKNSKEPEYSFPPGLERLLSNASTRYYKPTPECLLQGQVITIDHFLPDNLCNELMRSFQDNANFQTTPLRKSKIYSPRLNDRFSIVDHWAAETLWQYFKFVMINRSDFDDGQDFSGEFSTAKSLNPQLRFYRYRDGHFFGQHYDESVECCLASDPQKRGRTKWTLLIYLTESNDFQGGATIFHIDDPKAPPLKVRPKKGMALLHKHGDDCLKHEGELVKNGEKWILRSDVTF